MTTADDDLWSLPLTNDKWWGLTIMYIYWWWLTKIDNVKKNMDDYPLKSIMMDKEWQWSTMIHDDWRWLTMIDNDGQWSMINNDLRWS